MIVRYVVGTVSVVLATTSMAVCFSDELRSFVDANFGSMHLAVLSLGWLGVHFLTFRREYRPLFER
jgi:hypothetical protein